MESERNIEEIAVKDIPQTSSPPASPVSQITQFQRTKFKKEKYDSGESDLESESDIEESTIIPQTSSHPASPVSQITQFQRAKKEKYGSDDSDMDQSDIRKHDTFSAW